jgi:hypothetical protein
VLELLLDFVLAAHGQGDLAPEQRLKARLETVDLRVERVYARYPKLLGYLCACPSASASSIAT